MKPLFRSQVKTKTVTKDGVTNKVKNKRASDQLTMSESHILLSDGAREIGQINRF